MIAYRDFETTRPPAFFAKLPDVKSAFEAALALANEWIDEESVELLNVETVIHGENHPLLGTIRVWYRARS